MKKRPTQARQCVRSPSPATTQKEKTLNLDRKNSSSAPPPLQNLRIKEKALNLGHGNNDLHKQDTGPPGAHRGHLPSDRACRPHRRELPGRQPGAGGEQW